MKAFNSISRDVSKSAKRRYLNILFIKVIYTYLMEGESTVSMNARAIYDIDIFM